MLTCAMPAFADVSGTPVGIWQTIDDHTHQPTTLVQITQNGDGTFSGKIIKGLSRSFSNANNHKDSVMSDTSRSRTSAAEQAELFKKRVQYFGATDPKEIDPGALTVIHAWAMDGLEPNDKRRER